MRRLTTGATALPEVVRLAVPVCQQAERASPRAGPGRPPDIPDWLLAALILVAVLMRKKTKSAQYRFLADRRAALAGWLGTDRFPSRSTYFDRYRRAHRLFAEAIRLQGRRAVADGLADPAVVAVDKSLLAGRRGRAAYRRRARTVEPFHEWLARAFELDRAWHRGLGNNRTQVLAAIFAYQVLLRYNHRRGHRNGRVKAILDRL